ncbi:MAG TPA: DinB family protein [Pyrinomonadaceae bacterium]|nr:DinB family protein [Pyrinomonadaceae bacterium]
MKQEEIQTLIAKYKAGYDEVIDGLNEFPAESLAAHPIPGKWSAREIVHHLGDSETVAAVRLRRLLSEDNPVIQGYDQDEYATRLKYNEREMEPSLDAFRAARVATAQIMDGLSLEDWSRKGSHTEHGSYSATDWLKIYADHAHNHAAQIRALKIALAS